MRRLTGAGDDWELLFLQGGASTQFFTIPMNLGANGDYVVTGAWAKKALAECKKLGTGHAAASSAETDYDRIPSAFDLRDDAAFVHVTSNNTIYGTQWRDYPETKAPLVCDASSDILSRPLGLERFGLVYAGAQKNLGPAGVTVVLIRKELLERAPDGLPTMVDYRTHAKKGSLFNTGPTFSIYVVGLVAKWLEAQGGVAAIEQRNEAKAKTLYDAIDGIDLFQGHAQPEHRSRMNVTFRLADDALTGPFLAGAKERGLWGLKGHRSIGGCRASIYNAMPAEGVDALVAYMKEFAAERG